MPATSAQQFVKLPQFVVESAEGTFPTASPSFTTCGSNTELEFHKINELVPIGQVGQEDPLDVAGGQFRYEMSMRAQLTNSTFLKRFVKAVNWATPTGTIAETLSILWSQYINGATENYIKARGFRPRRVTLELPRNGPILANYDLVGIDIAKPVTAHGLTTPSFAANPSGTVWIHNDGGVQPVSWNTIALNAKSISLTIERNTQAEPILGQNNPYGTLPHARQVRGTLAVLYTASEATTLETDFDGITERTLAWIMKTATSTVTVTAAKLEDYSRRAAADDNNAMIETASFTAEAIDVS